MKLTVLLTPLVAVTAAGWLGMEGYYLATGSCPLSGCHNSQEGAVAAQPVTAVTTPTSSNEGCCPMQAPAAAIPIAATPATATPSEGACCPSLAGAHATSAVAPGAVAPAGHAATAPGAVRTTGAPSDGCCPVTPNAAVAHDGACMPGDACPPSETCMPGDACGPNEVCGPNHTCESKTAHARPTGLETPSAAMDCDPTGCDEGGGCCSGEDAVAPVDTQAPLAPRE